MTESQVEETVVVSVTCKAVIAILFAARLTAGAFECPIAQLAADGVSRHAFALGSLYGALLRTGCGCGVPVAEGRGIAAVRGGVRADLQHASLVSTVPFALGIRLACSGIRPLARCAHALASG